MVQNNGTLSDAVAGTSAIEADLTNAVGATIAVGAGAELVLRSGTQDLRGTLSGAGTLSFGFGADATIGTTAVTVANLKLQGGNGGAALTLGNNLSYGGTLSFAGQFDEIALNGKVLTLSGSGNSLLGNSIDGGGASRLKITGSATIGGNGQIGGAAGTVIVEDAGTLNQNGTAFFSGSVLNNSGRTYALTSAGNITTLASATFTNNGTLQDNAAGESAIFIGFTNNGVIALGAGATLRLAGTSVLNGSVSGAGTLFLGGGTTTLNANIDAAAWHVGGGGTVTLARNIAYAGSFLIDNGFTRLQTAGHTLTLTGATDFQASVLDGTVGLSDRLSVTGSQIDLSALAFDHWTAGEDDILLNGTNGNDTIQARRRTTP